MLIKSNEKYPTCYSLLDKVFPMTTDGLREVRSLCWNCSLRIQCLRDAIKTNEQYSKIKDDSNNRNDNENSLFTFIKRWSRLKNNSCK